MMILLDTSIRICIGNTKRWRQFSIILSHARRSKITEKVSFSIASEASYVYVFNGPKLIENAKLASF